jgi:dTDP-4-amino-4,6-dideoxygalactose transaminase
MQRRQFMAAAAAASTPMLLANNEKPALLGGKPVRTKGSPQWPRFDSREEKALLDVLRSGNWFRGSGKTVDAFEAAYAKLTGAKHCIATANGTSALITSLGAMGVGPGDEVIVPPYTFVATVNAVLMFGALPVFVDSDRETFQMDARKLEAAITGETVAILPVHLGGSAADLDTILAVGQKRKLPVLEDACQAHLGEWKNRKVGTWGDAGCFSFQASKNLNSGEGGAVLTNDEEFAEKCYTFHNNGRGRRLRGRDFTYSATGANLRLTEFQAALLMAQMTRIEEQSRTREQNAAYLTSLLREIKGIAPARTYEGCTRNAYHLYMFRYDPAGFGGLPRATFLKAMRAEGIPASAGYSPLNKEPFIVSTLQSRGYARVYTKERMAKWQERNRCPENDRLCEEAVWMSQHWLLGGRADMDQVAEAVRKIQAHAAALATA